MIDPNETSAATAGPAEPLPFPVRRRPRRRLLWLLVAGVVLVGGLVLYRQLRANGQEPVSYETVALAIGDVEKVVTATGTLSPLVTVTVGSQVSGRIQELLVDYNSRVTKGQVIARIDPQVFKTEVAQTRANLAAAQANLAKAEAAAREAKLQYERDRGLAEKKVVAPAEVQTRLAAYDSAKAQVEAARASVAQARAALSKARTNLTYTTIVSPIDGVVVSRSVDVGQTVAASLQAPTLFTIAEDLRKMEIHTSVAESDVGRIVEGMKVRFTVDAFPDEEFDGTVKQVRYEAQTVQNVVTYDAVIRVDNRDLKLRPGMTANVTVVVARRTGVLRLPNAALRFRPPEGSPGTKRGSGPPPAPGTGKGPGAGPPSWPSPGGPGRRAAPPPGFAGGAGGPGAVPPPGAPRGAVPPPGAPRGKGPGGALAAPPPSSQPTTGRPRQVFVLRRGAPVPVMVETGVSDGSFSEVRRGDLQAGDRVIVGVGAKGGGTGPRGRGRGFRKGPPRLL